MNLAAVRASKAIADTYTVVDEYSPDYFYLRSTNKRGFATAIRARIPPEIAGQIAKLVESRRFPWTTTNEFVNDAIYHRLHYAADATNDGQIMRILRAEKLASDTEMFEREMAALKTVVNNFRRTADEATRTGDWLLLCSLIIRTAESLDDIREPYKTELRGLIVGYRARMPEHHQPELDL